MATTSKSPMGTAAKGGAKKRAPGERMPLRKNTKEQRVMARLNPGIGHGASGYDHEQYSMATFKGRGGPKTPPRLKN